MKDEIFATVKLPLGGEATILEGQGHHLFVAMTKSKGELGSLTKHLIIELATIDGKPITEKQIDEMHIRDVNYLSTMISTMMSDVFKDGF